MRSAEILKIIIGVYDELIYKLKTYKMNQKNKKWNKGLYQIHLGMRNWIPLIDQMSSVKKKTFRVLGEEDGEARSKKKKNKKEVIVV